MIKRAEDHLGVVLPKSYLDVLRQRNGGVPIRRCVPTPFTTSWAADHFKIAALLGLGGPRGIDTPGLGSPYLIKEWGYPDIGIVICDMPSGGHDAVMLDYTAEGEPAVAYIDEDRLPRRVAGSFSEFGALLTECPDPKNYLRD